MFDIREKPRMVERAFLVRIAFKNENFQESTSLLRELTDLVRTLGLPIVGTTIAHCNRPAPRLLGGSGKAKEIMDSAREMNADVIVFDNNLSPGQQRNWDHPAGC